MIIVSDFSKTFTTPNMPTSWSVFVKNGLLGDSYVADRNALYEANYPYEVAGDAQKTQEWFFDHAELFAKYTLSVEMIRKTVLDDTYVCPRDGVQEFLKEINKRNIPLHIVTSGITNFVEIWFQERFHFIPASITGNRLIIENGIVTGVDRSHGVNPLDKHTPFSGSDILLLGDNKEDLQMANNPGKTIGFTDDDLGYTISLGKNGSFLDVIPHLN